MVVSLLFYDFGIEGSLGKSKCSTLHFCNDDILWKIWPKNRAEVFIFVCILQKVDRVTQENKYHTWWLFSHYKGYCNEANPEEAWYINSDLYQVENVSRVTLFISFWGISDFDLNWEYCSFYSSCSELNFWMCPPCAIFIFEKDYQLQRLLCNYVFRLTCFL